MTTEALHGGDTLHHPQAFHQAHVCPTKLFLKVIISLLFLTLLTVVVSRFHFGSFNMLIAMAIAAVKASLVMTFFMHLKWDTAINNIAILSSFLFLSLLFVFTLSDLATRGDTDPRLTEPAMLQRGKLPTPFAPSEGRGHEGREDH